MKISKENFKTNWNAKLFFSLAGSTVYVHGKGARPTLSNCLIADSENVGVFITDSSQVTNKQQQNAPCKYGRPLGRCLHEAHKREASEASVSCFDNTSPV